MAEDGRDGLITGEDGCARCFWQGNLPDYQAYHDQEWGRPVANDWRLFEKIVLEGFQSGLSWLTILRKRENFRAAFSGFDIEAVARFTEADVERLLENPGIVRHRRKIESAINNAQRACDLIETEGTLASFVWRFEPDPSERPARADWDSLRTLTETDQSRAMAKELRRRGWSFVGPTTLYAFMQSVGLVNDHIEGCVIREQVEAERAAFVRPV
ncbi:DNA-3-methyladenine glycosylase I [Amorphus coralli]|uniref:DNA-3-methyladenine glycosylase I n=1 Tax=Amorphus coralli TaxID=340680 RepID=UPI0003713799|nr:DNA-3-methyladenine glycosylase I [Amorphus coralli]